MQRKRKENQSVNRRPLAWPSILVACGWLALWLLWPKAPAAAPRRPGVGSSSVAYSSITAAEDLYVAPDLFGLPSSVGFRAALESEVEAPEMSPAYRAGRRHLLPPRAETFAPVCDETAGRVADAAAATLTRYQPRWNDPPLFTTTPNRAMQLTVDPSVPLRDRGFRVEELAGAVSNFLDTAWQASLYAELGADGRAAYVFVDQGSGRTGLDDTLVRAFLHGRGSAGEAPAGGLVDRKSVV